VNWPHEFDISACHDAREGSHLEQRMEGPVTPLEPQPRLLGKCALELREGCVVVSGQRAVGECSRLRRRQGSVPMVD
jgi:hypothetical protein